MKNFDFEEKHLQIIYYLQIWFHKNIAYIKLHCLFLEVN